MLENLNNIWILLISIFILYIIIYKIININEPLDDIKYIEKLLNQKKLKKKINFDSIKKNLPNIATYYFGL